MLYVHSVSAVGRKVELRADQVNGATVRREIRMVVGVSRARKICWCVGVEGYFDTGYNALDERAEVG